MINCFKNVSNILFDACFHVHQGVVLCSWQHKLFPMLVVTVSWCGYRKAVTFMRSWIKLLKTQEEYLRRKLVWVPVEFKWLVRYRHLFVLSQSMISCTYINQYGLFWLIVRWFMLLSDFSIFTVNKKLCCLCLLGIECLSLPNWSIA